MGGRKVAIIGAGAMGAALAVSLERGSQEVSILATKYDEAVVSALEDGDPHPGLGQRIPSSIAMARWGAWAESLAVAEIVVLAVSSSGISAVVREARPMLRTGAVLAIATKGWDSETARPLSQVVAEDAPGHPVIIVVGPSLALELAAGTPTGLVCAGSDPEAAAMVAETFRSQTVRTYVTTDLPGVEVGAALKNVLAIAIGMCDGIAEAQGRSMMNTKAALFSRGLIEMARLAKALGGKEETILGLAGSGDLFVTVLGGRNGRFGRLVGSGVEPRRAISEMGTTVEGFDNTDEAVRLMKRHSLDLPVVAMVYKVLYEGADPADAIESLMLGPVESELG
ncbi:MAG: NAD(P)H-dependent glycerol-3-phosphate dehydrogenase [Actinobacteria bacterium]|nr:NAD(P)H-dependent glycerol-3-phosphate dehydrogenase [Actinomycetota bacterium]